MWVRVLRGFKIFLCGRVKIFSIIDTKGMALIILIILTATVMMLIERIAFFISFSDH